MWPANQEIQGKLGNFVFNQGKSESSQFCIVTTGLAACKKALPERCENTVIIIGSGRSILKIEGQTDANHQSALRFLNYRSRRGHHQFLN